MLCQIKNQENFAFIVLFSSEIIIGHMRTYMNQIRLSLLLYKQAGLHAVHLLIATARAILGKVLITGRGLEMRENSIGINPDDGQRNADERIW